MGDKTIQTEVDRLVSLVQTEERISVRDAAKKLNMPVATISEWSSFLEEEGVINIEYKFTTPFLVRRKMTEAELAEIKSNVKEEKKIFTRKSESTLNYLNKLETEVDALKSMFNDLGKKFKNRISDVDSEFKELRKAEDEKEKLNKQLIESKQKFIKNIDDINKELMEKQANSKAIYDFVYNQSQMGSQILHIQENELELIKETDKILDQKLKALKKKIDLKKKGKLEGETQSNLSSLERKYQKLKEYLDSEKKVIEELSKENQKQEEQIKEMKKEVLSKIQKSSDKIDKTITDVKQIPKKLKLFIGKKDKILKILEGISYNEKMLKEKLTDLMKRGSAINIAGNAKDVMAELRNLEQSLSDISKKRSFFESEIKKVFGLLHKK